MIACGGNHIIIKNEKNEIYVCGGNAYGQLGLSDDEDRNQFEKVEQNLKIKNILCGEKYTVIQDEKNGIYACGVNHGQLSLGDYEYRNIFEKVEFDFGKIRKIACGYCHIVIQNEKNEVYVRGNNYYGQLGMGDNKHRYGFEKVKYNFGEIKNIACGGYHTVIQNEKNEIYVCSRNFEGQLGLGDKNTRYKFERIEQNFGEIKKIACGGFHTIIQNEKNEIYVCGLNEYGQLGLGDNKDRNIFEKVEHNLGKIKNITCGKYHTIIQNDKSEIYACGDNRFGQLGLGNYNSGNKFEKVENNFGEIKNIACGKYYTIIQNGKNEIYVCGSNHYGQLGLGDDEDRNKFEKVNTDDIFEKIYNFELKLNVNEIAL